MQDNNSQPNNTSDTDKSGMIDDEKNKNKTIVDFPLIVIGASMGGMNAIQAITSMLPGNLEAAVLIVWHMPAETLGILPQVLNRQRGLIASNAKDGEEIQKGHIYVAPPDHHLLVEGNKLRTTKGPKENRFRPAVDPLFRSAAYEYGTGVIGIILSGALDDGKSGLWTIKNRGGIAIVQDPNDAEVSSMPQNAIRYVAVDYVVPVAEIPHLLMSLVKEQILIPKHTVMKKDERLDIELTIAADENGLNKNVMSLGELSPFTCPECHGVLTAIMEGDYQRFRCHTGHAFSSDSLLAALTEHIEESLWDAIRSIKESTMLMNHIGDHFADRNDSKMAGLYFRKAQEAQDRARQVRAVVTKHEQLSKENVEEGLQQERS